MRFEMAELGLTPDPWLDAFSLSRPATLVLLSPRLTWACRSLSLVV